MRELLLNDRFAEVRLAALDSLQRQRGLSELSTFAQALENETDDKILTFLVQNFMNLPRGSNVDSLIKRNLREDLTPGLLDLSLMIFIQQSQSSAKPVALKGLSSENWMVRTRSLEFLGSVTPQGSEDRVGHILATDQNEAVRVSAVATLRKIGTILARQLVKNASDLDASSNVRDAAKRALAEAW